MRRPKKLSTWFGLAGLLGGDGDSRWASRADAQTHPSSAQGGQSAGPPLKKQLVRIVRMNTEDGRRSRAAGSGPGYPRPMRAGETITLPGLGEFRDRPHRGPPRSDQAASPATIPARNIVEFVAGGDLTSAASAPGAVPAVERSAERVHGEPAHRAQLAHRLAEDDARPVHPLSSIPLDRPAGVCLNRLSPRVSLSRLDPFRSAPPLDP